MQTCDVPGLMPVETAIENMQEQVSALNEFHVVPLENANGRTLASPIFSSVNVPPADNSAMDGYALRFEDAKRGTALVNIGTSLAGQPFSGVVAQGQCVRIMTGAVIPEGADCVVMQENAEVTDNGVVIQGVPSSGENIRRAGEDIKEGDVVVSPGTRLTPAHLSLIASVGIGECEVVRKVRVALIATGDELVSPGNQLKAGQIFESNRYALRGLLEQAGCDILDLGIVADNMDALTNAFVKADEQCDLVISSGGVSVGDADYVKVILEKLGTINFWKVAIKPGKPFAFGKLNNSWFCGLPGNPVSSYVTFEQLVTPVLNKLTGRSPQHALNVSATASERLRKRPGRADYQRGIYFFDESGNLLVKANGKQGSGIMSSVANANCYIILDKDSGDIEKGSVVTIQPFGH